MTRRSIRQRKKQREAEKNMAFEYSGPPHDGQGWSPRRVTRPQWFLDACEAEWNAIPTDVEELRAWMKGEPINTVGPNGERL